MKKWYFLTVSEIESMRTIFCGNKNLNFNVLIEQNKHGTLI